MRQKGFWNTGSMYGWDGLSKFLVFVGLAFLVSPYTLIMGVIIGVYALWRTFSKDMEKRRREQIVFENWIRKLAYKLYVFRQKSGLNDLGRKIKGFYLRVKGRRNYLVVRCPNCSQNLRLPRRKGTLMVTCKSCSFKFKKKT